MPTRVDLVIMALHSCKAAARQLKNLSQVGSLVGSSALSMGGRLLVRSFPGSTGLSKRSFWETVFLRLLPQRSCPFHCETKGRFRKIGENQKGTAGRGREKKCHDNLRQTSRQFATFYNNLRHFMTISVSLFH